MLYPLLTLLTLLALLALPSPPALSHIHQLSSLTLTHQKAGFESKVWSRTTTPPRLAHAAKHPLPALLDFVDVGKQDNSDESMINPPPRRRFRNNPPTRWGHESLLISQLQMDGSC